MPAVTGPTIWARRAPQPLLDVHRRSDSALREQDVVRVPRARRRRARARSGDADPRRSARARPGRPSGGSRRSRAGPGRAEPAPASTRGFDGGVRDRRRRARPRRPRSPTRVRARSSAVQLRRSSSARASRRLRAAPGRPRGSATTSVAAAPERMLAKAGPQRTMIAGFRSRACAEAGRRSLRRSAFDSASGTTTAGAGRNGRPTSASATRRGLRRSGPPSRPISIPSAAGKRPPERSSAQSSSRARRVGELAVASELRVGERDAPSVPDQPMDARRG